ncbi:O-antigen ligase family protein [Rhizobium wenxiniae]|uniref:O-antigen ligase family protein n=1 Tax=Rhizobium wenxiniae TaxID=1737357 RepID=UPI001C6EF1DE|nr:O-antigen ligase [Rhizobium wenxiniae]MBW9086945.1 O-antigen ligase family protein [Rhizobium wenxiniae]
MKIARSMLVDPDRNQVYGIAAVALSFFVFAYSSRFGQVSILAYYALWFPLILVDYKRVLGNYFRYLWILAFPLLCFLSAFWSPAPGVSLRTAIQFLTHLICALIAMRTISVLTLTRGSIVGTVVVMLYSIAFGSYSYDAMDGSYSFVGSFSSKNQLGLYASLGLVFSVLYAIVFRRRDIWLVGAGAAALLCAYCLMASQSATSVITTAGLIAACIAYLPFGLLSPGSRKLLFVGIIVIGSAVVVAGLQMGAVDAILGLFGKDSTLTGRTYLWQQGIEAAHLNPVLGMGYQGFWVQGFAKPEQLWDEFFIATRSGFHFHNTYIEVAVENGLVGLALLVFVLLRNVFGHLGAMLNRRNDPASITLFAVSLLLLMRSFVEIDVIFPYQIGSFLMFYAAGKLTLRRPVPQLPQQRYRHRPIAV